jgi:hypothetical protein
LAAQLREGKARRRGGEDRAAIASMLESRASSAISTGPNRYSARICSA